MNEILTYLIPALIGALPTGTLMYWTYNRKLKALEVKKEEVTTIDQTIQLWKNLYETVRSENEVLKQKAIEREEKIMSLRDEVEAACDKYHQSQLDSEKKERQIVELIWHKCTRNCRFRKPPRIYGEDELPEGVEEEDL